METVESLKKYTIDRKSKEDELWLADTKSCIGRTSALRDELGEFAKRVQEELPKDAMRSDPIQRQSVHLIASRSQPYNKAHPKSAPLQRAQFQILAEATSNLWIATGRKDSGLGIVTRMHQGLMRLDAALQVTKPLDKKEKTFEEWWRHSIGKLPQKQYDEIQSTLIDVGAYFYTHAPTKFTQPIAKSATSLAAQIGRAKEPPYMQQLGKKLIRYIQGGLNILAIWNPPAGAAGKAIEIGMNVLEQPDVE